MAVLALIGAAGASETVVGVSDAQMKASGVRTVPLAQAGSASVTLPAQVSIPNNQLYVISAPMEATVQVLAVAPGDSVKRGQLLARLMGASVVEAQRDYLQAASQLALAAQTLKRDEQLFREGIIAEARYQASRAAHSHAAAMLAEKRQALRIAGLPDKAVADLGAGKGMSGTLDLVAPADGAVLEQDASVGQRVDAAAPLSRIGRLSPLWLDVQVPVTIAADLVPGALVRAAGGKASGKVIAVGRQVNPATQSVVVRAQVSEGAAFLRPGQYVEAGVDLPPPPAGTWRVPLAAVVRQQENAFLFVQQQGGFRLQPVRIAGQAGETALVSGPLTGGERIVVAGTAALKAAAMGVGKAE